MYKCEIQGNKNKETLGFYNLEYKVYYWNGLMLKYKIVELICIN